MAYRCTRCAGTDTEELDDPQRPDLHRSWCNTCTLVFTPEQPPRLVDPGPRTRRDIDE